MGCGRRRVTIEISACRTRRLRQTTMLSLFRPANVSQSKCLTRKEPRRRAQMEERRPCEPAVAQALQELDQGGRIDSMASVPQSVETRTQTCLACAIGRRIGVRLAGSTRNAVLYFAASRQIAAAFAGASSRNVLEPLSGDAEDGRIAREEVRKRVAIYETCHIGRLILTAVRRFNSFSVP